MREVFRVLAEFNKESYEPSFIKEEKEVSGAIQQILSKTYLNDGNEVDLVKETINAMNRKRGSRFKLESVFIHGNKSQIQFDYYGKTAKKEMGDLVFVSTLTFGSKPFFQKMTIVQAKKDSHKKQSSWGIDPEQLFFLSYWPSFQGVRGIFPPKKITVQDHSGCLGSYALYREPGDFVFIAAKRLERYLGQKKRISLEGIHDIAEVPYILEHNKSTSPFFPFNFYPFEDGYRFSKEMYYFYREFGAPFFWGQQSSGLNVMKNEVLCTNVFDTVSQLARMNIGELVFSHEPEVKTNEYAYRLLNTIVRYVINTEQGHDMDLIRYNGEGPVLEVIDLQGTSLGIVHMRAEVSPG